MRAFHEADWSSRAALLGSLADTRLQVLGERLLYTEASEVMPGEGMANYHADVSRRLLADEGAVPWLTLPKAIRETDELLAASNGGAGLCLKELREYLCKRAEEALATITSKKSLL